MKNNLNHSSGLYVGVIAITLSFFLGYLYAVEKYNFESESYNQKIQYVDIKVNTRNIEIKNTPENVLFRVDGEVFHTGSINLK